MSAPKTLTVEAEGLDPWAVLALFKYAQNVCRRHGLSKVKSVECSISVTFEGPDGEASPEEAKATLETWKGSKVWVGDAEVHSLIPTTSVPELKVAA